jgi:hypothetical protein
MTTQVMVPANGIPQSFEGPFSGVVATNSDGSITIDTRDIPYAMSGGFLPAFTRLQNYQTSKAPAAVSASTIVASATPSNTALTIASQPDIARQLQAVYAPGAAATGNLAMIYTANDGTTQTDNFSLTGSTTATFTTSKGVLHLTSATITGFTGGSSPTIEVGTNATISVPIPPNSLDVTIISEELDGADVGTNTGTLTNKGLYTPHTAPNGTHLFTVNYTRLSSG